MNTSPTQNPHRFLYSLVIFLAFFSTSLYSRADSLVELAHSGKRAEALALVKESAKLESRDSQGYTALHWAALNGDHRLVKALLKNGADANALNKAGATPLVYAVENIESVKALLDAGAKVNSITKLGTTVLSASILNPNAAEVALLLLKKGADPNVQITTPNSEIYQANLVEVAAWNGNEELVDVLLATGIKPTNVIAAAYKGHSKIVEKLLSEGADLNFADPFSGHALNAALYSQNPDIARMLIEKGADLNLRSPFGQHETPPMLWSAYNETNDDSIARALIAKGVDVNTSSALGETALDWARARNNLPLEKVLLAAGAKPGTKPIKQKLIPNHPLPQNSDELNPLIRDSIGRAIDLLQSTSDGFLNSGVVQKQKCVSCHQQTMPAVPFGWALERGMELDRTSIARQVQDQIKYWSKDDAIAKAHEMIPPEPDAPMVLGYGIQGLSALGHQRDSLVEAMVRYLSARQMPDGSWSAADYRPPMEDGPILGTAFAIRSLQLYPVPGIAKKQTQVVHNAREYLHKATPQNFNQQLHQLMGLAWSGEKTSKMKSFADAIIAKQKTDGGWSQLNGLPSDSWATGLALVALQSSGVIQVTDTVYKKGVRFLLRTQFEDGSWYVRSRAWPFQPQFESGFPHGKDQWISEGGTVYAIMALLLTQPKTNKLPNIDWMAIDVPEMYSKNKRPPKRNVTALPGHTTVDYRREIKPILERSCYGCHSSEARKLKGDFNIEKRENLLKGGQSFDPVVAIGSAEDSDLIWMVGDRIEDLEMPPLSKRDDHPALSSSEIKLLETWINEGLVWESE